MTSFTGTAEYYEYEYKVFKGRKSVFEYEFTQVEDCGYEQTVEIIGLPYFMKHISAYNVFTLYTDDNRDYGLYTFYV